MMSGTALFSVFLGGGIGAVLRYGSSYWLASFAAFQERIHWATFLANLMASVTLVLVYKYTEGRPTLALLLATGLCGGWSTFSTFSFETAQLFQQGRTIEALAYVFGSTLIGVGAVYLIADRLLWSAPVTNG